MSASYALRTKGEPYFGFVQANTAHMSGADAPYERVDTVIGFTLEIWFRIYALPPALASPDEYHKIFSYQQTDGTDLAWLAVTPSGRIAGGAMGITLQSSNALIAPSGSWHAAQIQASNEFGAQITFLNYQLIPEALLVQNPSGLTEGMPAIASSAAARSLVAPAAGKTSRFVIGNGGGVLNRTGLAFWYAAMLGDSGSIGEFPFACRWPISDRHNTNLPGILDLDIAIAGLGYDADLSPVFISDDPSLPYGTVPSASPRSAYRWELFTPFTKLERPQTVWARQ